MSSGYNKEIQYGILKKYFKDRATEEEKKLVNQWLNNAESIKVESYLRLLWKETEPDPGETALDLNLLLDKIHHSINLIGIKEDLRTLPVRSSSDISFRSVFRNIARIAAILLLPILGYLSWEIYNQKMWVKNQAEVVYNEIICPLGARSQFQLPDGTKGSLNNGSRLKYPIKFTGKSREVELVGEAFFNVYHDKNRPFIINTAGLDVKVLGTRLNVYSYPEEGYQEFTLESGTVELIKRENNQEIPVARLKSGQHLIYSFDEEVIDVEQLQPDKKPVIIDDREKLDKFLNKMKQGQRAVYKLKDGDINIIIDETEQYTSWKDGKLVLRNDPMPRLLKRIERWYNVKFNIIDESIKEYTYWATFEEENLEQVFKLLSLTGPIKFEKRPRGKMADGTYNVQEIDVLLKK